MTLAYNINNQYDPISRFYFNEKLSFGGIEFGGLTFEGYKTLGTSVGTYRESPGPMAGKSIPEFGKSAPQLPGGSIGRKLGGASW